MSARAYVTIWCDAQVDGHDCGQFVETPCNGSGAARAFVLTNRPGWKLSKRGDFCPEHASPVPTLERQPNE